jgi:hypothetical protein
MRRLSRRVRPMWSRQLPSSGAWPERRDVVTLEHIPAWLEPNVRVSRDAVEYAPIQRPSSQKCSGLASLAQLIATSAIGVVLYIGISDWVYPGRHPATTPGHMAAPPPPAQPPQPAAANARQPAGTASAAPAVRRDTAARAAADPAVPAAANLRHLASTPASCTSWKHCRSGSRMLACSPPPRSPSPSARRSRATTSHSC